MAEFKIGRLRFTWRGQWSTGTFYNRDAVSQYNGKTYVCLEPHTSDDFYDDLSHINQAGALTPYWELMVDGKVWKEEWTPSTPYSLGNIVRFGGTVYICTTPHTSGATLIDLVNWTTYSSIENWNNAWATTHAYGVGDTVKYGGIVYRCLTVHVSASSAADGLEFDQSKWEVVNNGVDYKGSYLNNTRYKKNDIVRSGADMYICTTGHANATFDSSKWNIWLPGLDFMSSWMSNATYQPGDIVVYGGYTYECTSFNNANIIPSTNTSDWTTVTQGYSMKADWNGGTDYKIGDVVRKGGQLFAAVSDNNAEDPSAFQISSTYTSVGSAGTTIVVASTAGVVPGMILSSGALTEGQTVVKVINATTILMNKVPSGALMDGDIITFIGINYVFWTLVTPGSDWKKFWEQDAQYVVTDLVVWGNKTYKCISDHVSSQLSRPDVDVVHSYWIDYALHARENAGNSQGDLVTFANGATTSIPFGPDEYVLRATAEMPTWSKILKLDNIFYVATNGVDDSAYGDTQDKPFRTIKYACEKARKGTMFQNANELLVANKDWLVEEVWQWMVFQKNNNLTPFTTASVFDETASKRDAKLIIDAISYDISRGGNSQIVSATIRYFADGSVNEFYNAETDAAQPLIVAALEQLSTFMTFVFENDAPDTNYQILNSTWDDTATYADGDVVFYNEIWYESLTDSNLNNSPDQSGSVNWLVTTAPALVEQVIDTQLTPETGIFTEVSSLINIPIVAIGNADNSSVPPPNQGLTTSIFIKTGTYSEVLPIVIPENTALCGDELRGVVVQPITNIITTATRTYSTGNIIRLETTEGLAVDMPIQFATPQSDRLFGREFSRSDIVLGRTYYVASITDNDITIADAIDGNVITLENSIMQLDTFAGDSLKDMFYVRNATGIRNMTLTGLMGTLTPLNQNLTRRPTGGSFVSLDPGTGPDDTTAWIIKRSPYIQNVTNFGVGCTGLKIDGTLHTGGNKSIVCNDFTQIISDGIGVWCTGTGSLTECVSVFSYYNYAGYLAEDGGRIRATNGNSSYGTYGCIAEGYDATESPITGLVDNRSSQVQASVQSAFGANAQLLTLQYSNAGSGYNTTTTNLLKYSNDFINTSGWTTDGNVTIQQNLISPTGYSDAWTLAGLTSTSDSSYVYQTLTVSPPGATYSALVGLNVTGSGIGAEFNISVFSTSYSVTVNTGGSGYVIGNEIRILGSALGGIDGVNDCFLTVATLSGSTILTATAAGTVPAGSAMPYTFSIYGKQGTSNSFDVYAIFSGNTTVTSSINYNFVTGNFTPSGTGGGFVPTSYSKLELPNGWFRFSFTFNDSVALNDTLQLRIYPRGRAAPVGTTKFYGAQLQIGTEPSFYLETRTNQPTAYANFKIVGSGTGGEAVGDELRSSAIFQTRITDVGNGIGGADYLTASNNAQGGDDSSVILAGSDTNTASNYIGMRCFINSGTGAGQYGFISAYAAGTSFVAQILKESFIPLSVDTADNTTGELSLAPSFNTSSLYLDQPIQFIPTYYSTVVSKTSVDSIAVTAAIGGTVNTFTVSSTAKLSVNMPVRFFGTVFSTVVENYTYFIKEIIDSTTISISNEIFGTTWLLTAGTGTMDMFFPGNNSYITGSTTNMQVNMPVQFTGTSIGGINVGDTYYINDVLDANTFTVSSTLVEVECTASNSSTDALSVASSAPMVPLNPILFSGVTFGNVVAGTTYYVNKIVNPTSFTITDTLISVRATATQLTTNLITVTDTTGFVAGNPIIFTGNTFGGITNGTTYYILAINDGTTFTISATPGGSAKDLTTAFGDVGAKTTAAAFQLTTTTGSMTGASTNAKTILSNGYGTMNGTFSTKLFGNVVAGTTYYVSTINGDAITVSATISGADIVLKTDTGSMNIAAVGWDHINPGTLIEPVLDNSSIYFIEPRTIFSAPAFTQEATTTVVIAPETEWVGVAYGNNKWIAIPSGNATAAITADGTTWEVTTLPEMNTWTDIAYGNNYWVIISSGGLITDSVSKVAVSNSDGLGWRMSSMPSKTTWSNVAYGNGKFVAIASGTTTSAYSVNYGKTWVSGTGLANATWTGLAYGNGKFVAVASGGTTASYSTTGASWTTVTLPSSTDWSDITFGNGIFVVVSSTSAKSAYSQDGITWYESNTAIAATKITYGQGVFVAVTSGNTSAYTTENGVSWAARTVTGDTYGAMAFGFDATDDFAGKFISVSDQSVASIIIAGCTAKGRAVITSGKMKSISQWEAGSGYLTTPTVTFTDPNVTNLVTVVTRLSNGTLSNPTFVNRGEGYNTNSTAITITGSGYADTFQTGLTIRVKDLSSLPRPGDNLVIDGNSTIYKVTNATAVYGTVAPNIQANLQVSPEMTTSKSPTHLANVTIRQKYSQCRLTGHDFLNVGYGNMIQSNYPGLPSDTVLMGQDQAVETNFGRVFYTSTDQDGNFRVGNLFAVEQATGIVTLSASQFGLTGLETLSLGGIAVGGSSVVVRQFGTDSSFVANSNEIIPTQRSIKAYLQSRLSQGGANTFTGQLIAGTVLIGGPDKISSTIPEGTAGAVVNMPTMVNVQGEFAGWDGDGMAYAFFMRNSSSRTNGFGR